CTSSATPSNAALTGSSATAPSPPAMTSSPSAMRPLSTSPPSTNGCPELSKHALVPSAPQGVRGPPTPLRPVRQGGAWPTSPPLGRVGGHAPLRGGAGRGGRGGAEQPIGPSACLVATRPVRS